MKKLLLVTIVCLFHSTLYSQIKLSGHIINQDGEYLSSVNIRLLHTDSTFVAGISTNNDGYYHFDKLVPDNYLLVCSMIGYKQHCQQVRLTETTKEMPTIILITDSIMLNEVEIKGKSYLRLKDRVLIIPSKEQKKSAFSGYDLLYNLMIPGLDVDRNNGDASTLRGNVTFYIDGVAANAKDIRLLRPRDIERVEFHEIPKGRFTGDRASINYITKKYKSGGYVTFDGKQTIGYMKGDYNGGAKLTYNNTNYTLFAGDIHEKHSGIETEKTEEFSFPQHIFSRNKTTEKSSFKSNQQYIQLKVTNSKKKRNLSGLLSLVHSQTPENNSSSRLVYLENNNNIQETNAFQTTSELNLKPSFALKGDFQLTEKQFLRVMADGTYTRNSYERIYTESFNSTQTDVDESLYNFYIRGWYNIDLKHNNSFGAMFHHHHDITQSTYKGNYASWQHLWKGESQLFLNYTQSIGKKISLNISPGVSMLNYKLHGEDLQRFWTFRMDSYLIYQINSNQQIAGGFAAGNEYPVISYLNTVDQQVDFLLIKRGNPALDNTKIYTGWGTYGAQFNRLGLQWEMQYMKYINNVYPDYYTEGNKLIQSFRADGNFHTLTTTLSASYRLPSHLQAKVKLGYQQTKSVGYYRHTENSVIASLDFNYYWKDFSFNLFAYFPQVSLQKESLITQKTPFRHGLRISWHLKGWMIETGADNPLTKQSNYRNYADFKIYNFEQTQSSRIYQQTGYIKVAYTFDFGRKTERTKKEVDTKINSAILKAE